jgi:MraZ protein
MMSAHNSGKYFGEYRHSMDDKGRLTIPSQWRPQLESKDNNFLALPSLTEKSVSVYPPMMIEQLYERFSEISMGDQKGQGRINLNEKLINHADLEKSVVLLGEASKFMIYDEAFYDQLMADDEDTEDLADIAKGFGF